MNDKLKLWDEYSTWSQAEEAWNHTAVRAEKSHPLKQLPSLPSMVGITPETAKHLKWKSLRWMITKDEGGKILRNCLKHPLKYGWAFLKSAFAKKPFKREGDFFLYGLNSLAQFESLVQDPLTLFVMGFSYCHKPFECPSKRFTPECIHDPHHPVCQQCFIGKAVNALPKENTIPLFIPTIHYIGEKIFDIVHQNPDKKVIFIITACEMTLEMFGDWGNMVGIQGLGVRLDGRICNTLKAFELSERGVKPGLTVVLEDTKSRILDFIKQRRANVN